MAMLCFRLPGHGDNTLKHMDSLRSCQHFCDITIVASNNQTFRGHKVVLAACSPFLRDQFLLNPSSKLQVTRQILSSIFSLKRSWYCVFLQFSADKTCLSSYRCLCCIAPLWCVICSCHVTLECCSSTQRRLSTT